MDQPKSRSVQQARHKELQLAFGQHHKSCNDNHYPFDYKYLQTQIPDLLSDYLLAIAMTLSIEVGANAPMFSYFNAFLLRAIRLSAAT
ncbi:MAG: hypothetical protein ACYSW7_12200 [Planctomycetota bacterium]|jgi:hypothetical protein